MNEKAMTLIEILVGVSLTFGIALMVSSAYKNYAKAQNYAAVKGELADLGAYVTTITSCSQTFTAAVKTTCTGKNAGHNQYVDVKKSDGTVVIALAQTTEVSGAYKLRAKCLDLDGFWGLLVEYFRMDAGTSAKRALATATDTWMQLNAGVPVACN